MGFPVSCHGWQRENDFRVITGGFFDDFSGNRPIFSPTVIFPLM
jgi:hypothetical protein